MTDNTKKQAIRPSTGDIIYDEFSDTISRTELETRISHIEPAELILPLNLSPRTEQLLVSLITKNETRTERLEPKYFQYTEAFQQISNYFKKQSKSLPSEGSQGKCASLLKENTSFLTSSKNVFFYTSFIYIYFYKHFRISTP